ncbi:hypothetical protein C0J52_19371 [Blattella germanica]|nr:hypothetical protein C0J52_19371 [Blattella germanica]
MSKLDLEVNAVKGRGPMGPSRRMIKKPLIAAVSGYAVAGGMELALMCVPLIDGGTVRLQALIGLSRAMDLILTGRAIKAQEAYEWGLANRLVACGTSLGQAINLANSLVKFPQECLRADRFSTYNAAFNAKSFDEAVDFEFNNGIPVVLKESTEGAKKFMSGIGRHGKFYNLTDGKQKSMEKSKL